MSKLSKGLTITAVSAALAGSIGFAYAQSSSTGQGSAANPSATTNGTVSTPPASGMSTTTDTTRSAPMNTQNNSTGTTSSPNLERGTGANANDGLNTMPATGAGNETSAPAPVSPDRPPRADRN
ncbi:hypothetical protein [Aquabacterium sp. CECT 9606]|uniref:hypothetical protein n=1 Tax=Aquabacterium sp. CECT 9606 TaxID=2845822 RepID=UPI001E56A261|nr:hypothetical protein [Aquabacterium sp. CECT 9606]CAH0351658.1 hypothetical protein AQB9606_02323 [Aquabacterium sp. CECT 9606]